MRQFWIVALEIGEIGLVVYCLNYLPQTSYLLALQGLVEGDPFWLVIRKCNQMLVEITKA